MLKYIFISVNISSRVFKVSVIAGRSISDFIFNVCNAMNHQFTTKDPKILATILQKNPMNRPIRSLGSSTWPQWEQRTPSQEEETAI